MAGERTDEFESFHPFQSKLSISKKGLLAFVTKSGESDALHVYDVTKNSVIETYQFKDLVVIASPSWSADGTQIAFTSIDKSGRIDLYIYTIATQSLLRLTNDIYDDRDPVWSPDGTSIIFSSDRAEYGNKQPYNLFRYDLKTGGISFVTSGRENYYSPSFSPDGKYLTFTSNADGAQNVWSIDSSQLRGNSLVYSMRKVTNLSNAAFDPVWTDKNELVFAGFEDYSFRIYQMTDAYSYIDSSRITHEFSPIGHGNSWAAESIEGDTTIQSTKYRGEYSLDIAQTQISTDPIFGTGGGAAIALSDVLGNDQYNFLLYNNAESSGDFLNSFNLAVSKISLGQRTNYATGIFHFSGRRYDLTDPDLFYYERAFGGYFVLSYPLSKFRRIEAGVTLTNSDKEVIYGYLPRKALLVSNAISFVHDNSLWGPTGPLDGSRFIATIGYTTDVQYSNVDYYTLIADYRSYLRLGQRMAFASRYAILYNDGVEARRFFMGGSWDLRGYPRWSLRGKKIWFTSQELRFPFVDQLGVRFPIGGIGFSSIRGALFFDAGNAWDDVYSQTLGSVGGGLRMNIGGVLVLRYDIGKTITNNYQKLQDGLFYQFFFGLDF